MSERSELPVAATRVGPASEFALEQPIELRRHLDALRRSRVFIVLFVLVATGTAVGVSLVLPKTYRATSTIVLDESLSPLGSGDVETIKRRLETIQRLLGTNDVLEAAAEEVPGETRSSIERKVTSSASQDANIISVTALAERPALAAEIANAVADAFLEAQADTERERLAEARTALTAELDRLRVLGGRPEEIQALQDRISVLAISEVNAGADLQLAQAAEAPSAPYTPRPVRNGVAAFFAALFLAVLGVLARDQLRPRIAGPRELGRIMNLPMLVGIPYSRRRFGRQRRGMGAIAHEAYQTLQASVRFELPPTTQRVVLVTSALEGEGKTSSAAGLARALARVGQKTLLVCADFRFPSVHEVFELERAPGTTDVLAAANDGNGKGIVPALNASVRRSVRGGGGNLDVLPSGGPNRDPAELLFSGALERFFKALEGLDYSYVVVDGPPLLGIADSHALAQRADGVLFVARLDRLNIEDIVEARDILDRLAVNPLGLVVVGTRRTSAYAYAEAGFPAVDETPPRRISV